MQFTSAAGFKVTSEYFVGRWVLLLFTEATSETASATEEFVAALRLATASTGAKTLQVVVHGLDAASSRFAVMPPTWLAAPLETTDLEAARFGVPTRPHVVILSPHGACSWLFGTVANLLQFLRCRVDMETECLGAALAPLLPPTAHAVALYFSAAWCGPCRQFTPKLAGWYASPERPSVASVLFVSLDHNEKAYAEYAATHPWPAIPWSSPIRQLLPKVLGVTSIPSLVVVDTRTFMVISKSGVSRFGRTCFPWLPVDEGGGEAAAATAAAAAAPSPAWLLSDHWDVLTASRTMLVCLADRLVDNSSLMSAWLTKEPPNPRARYHLLFAPDDTVGVAKLRMAMGCARDPPGTYRLVAISPPTESGLLSPLYRETEVERDFPALWSKFLLDADSGLDRAGWRFLLPPIG